MVKLTAFGQTAVSKQPLLPVQGLPQSGYVMRIDPLNQLAGGPSFEIITHVESLNAGRLSRKKLMFSFYLDVVGNMTLEDLTVTLHTPGQADDYTNAVEIFSSPAGNHSGIHEVPIDLEAINVDLYNGVRVTVSGRVTSAEAEDVEIYYSDVQLEIGEITTEFEYRPYSEELALCQRYYVSNVVVSGVNHRSGNRQRLFGATSFPVAMRTPPATSGIEVKAWEDFGTGSDFLNLDLPTVSGFCGVTVDPAIPSGEGVFGQINISTDIT
jgi:hypothetical protein